MKLRSERSGIHFFDRSAGLHLLCDEVKLEPSAWSVAPRILSVALSNICDLGCHFCYRPQTKDTLPVELVRQMVGAVDELGCLEVTFGGGEPLLYPGLSSLCEWIWDNTSMGVSLTTHGHRLTSGLIHKLIGRLSSIRFSVDGVEPYYSLIRGHPLCHLLEAIELLDHAIPFGINVVVSPGHVSELSPVVELAISLGAYDALIIPEHRAGKVALTPWEWDTIDSVITRFQSQCRLSVTYEACRHLNAAFLDTECDDEFVYAHVSADRRLKVSSYAPDGIVIRDGARMREYLLAMRDGERSFQ